MYLGVKPVDRLSICVLFQSQLGTRRAMSRGAKRSVVAITEVGRDSPRPGAPVRTRSPSF
jgi:hypothetical protein